MRSDLRSAPLRFTSQVAAPSEAGRYVSDGSLPRSIGGFDILSRIAVGGMAEIYLARARGYGGFEKRVVVKRLHDEFEGDPAFVRMLIDEARITAQLQHANIVQVMDLGIDQGRVFMALELVDGRDLFQVLKELHARELFMPIEAACYVVAELCLGLHFAHTRKDSTGEPLKIVHRDVSPQNVLLSWHGEVKLGDFGIVKATQRATETQAGVIKGKFYYMSPEQARGQDLDHRSDVFSAGIVLYETLTAAPLYDDEDDVQLMARVRSGRVDSPRAKRAEISPELEAICLRALAPERERRYATALELSRALTSYLASRGRAFTKTDLADFLEALFAAGAPSPGPELRSVDTDPELMPAGERPEASETMEAPAAVATAAPVARAAPRPAEAGAETVDGGRIDPPEGDPTRSVRPAPLEPTRRRMDAIELPKGPSEPPPRASPDVHEHELTARLSRAEIVALNQKIIEDLRRRGTDTEMPAVSPPLPVVAPREGAFPAHVDRKMTAVLLGLVALCVLLTGAILWLVAHPVEAPPSVGGVRPAARPDAGAEVPATPPPRAVTTAPFVEPSAEAAVLVVHPARPEQRYRLYVDGERVVVRANRVPLTPGRHTIEARIGETRMPPLEVEALAGQIVDYALPD